MSSRGDLFREEALEFHTRGEAASGGVVRLGARWLRWSFWLLLVVVAAGLAAAFFVHTNETSTGPAVVDARQGRFSALLPIAIAPDLRSARSLRIDLPGTGDVRVAVTRVRAVASRTKIAGLPSPTQPSILLSGRIRATRSAELSAGRIRGRATLVVRRERLGSAVMRQFRLMLGQGDQST